MLRIISQLRITKFVRNVNQVSSFLKKSSLPIVVKADGLAAGKGVTICKSRRQVLKSTNEIFNGKFKTSKKLILEEFLEGEEASYFVIVDKNNFKFFGTLKIINVFMKKIKAQIQVAWEHIPHLIEYNVRMGDPECQVILPRLKTDLVKIILKLS